MDLLLASGNPKKLAELERILAGLDVAFVTPDRVGPLPDVVEDGATFEENAAKKAREFAAAAGLPCLADDSGLEVDALGGAPGVRSARYAGDAVRGPHTDERNNAKLLAALAGFAPDERTARFVCALRVARPDGTLLAGARGTVEGRIATAPRGTQGFGYDPLFECTDPGAPAHVRGRTFGELGHEDKAVVSHRGRALRSLREALLGLNPDSH